MDYLEFRLAPEKTTRRLLTGAAALNIILCLLTYWGLSASNELHGDGRLLFNSGLVLSIVLLCPVVLRSTKWYMVFVSAIALTLVMFIWFFIAMVGLSSKLLAFGSVAGLYLGVDMFQASWRLRSLQRGSA